MNDPDKQFSPSPKPQPGAASGEQTREVPAAVCKDYCGDLNWTIEKWGRVTHKCFCPRRIDPWCQSHPDRCAEPLAKAGEFGIVTPEMLRDAEHEAGEDIPETEEQAYALYQRRAAALTRLLSAAPAPAQLSEEQVQELLLMAQGWHNTEIGPYYTIYDCAEGLEKWCALLRSQGK